MLSVLRLKPIFVFWRPQPICEALDFQEFQAIWGETVARFEDALAGFGWKTAASFGKRGYNPWYS
jgi:hypothetical protein